MLDQVGRIAKGRERFNCCRSMDGQIATGDGDGDGDENKTTHAEGWRYWLR